jgi:hypothetical protein
MSEKWTPLFLEWQGKKRRHSLSYGEALKPPAGKRASQDSQILA